MDYRIFPPDGMIETTVSLPLSKSICNRLLIINALNPEAEPLPVRARCDDSDVLAEILAMEIPYDQHFKVDVHAAGTAFRFLTAFFAAHEGALVEITGTERLRQRPISPLVDALRKLGAEIEYLEKEGFAPLLIRGHRLSGGEIEMNATVSSQFISALLMIAPTMNRPLTIKLDGDPISRPYILMTLGLMEQAGAKTFFERDVITIKNEPYTNEVFDIEPDWSAASYWYEIAAISAGFVTLPGLPLKSLQGDSATARYFRGLGVRTEESEEVDGALELCADPDVNARLETDLSETPDIAQTLAVTCGTLGINFHLKGLSSLKVKETDRLEALRKEMDKIGIIVEIRNDSELVWNGERHPIFEMPAFDTYQDHRMAMALAPVSIFIPGLIIRDIEVVSKSYPGFWDDLKNAGFTVTDASVPLPEPDESGSEK